MFSSISSAREYMDNDPAGFLSYAAIFASFFAGPAAMLLATGLSAASGVSQFEQGNSAVGGSEFIWTALFAIGTVLRLPIVQTLGTASKLKIANAMASSNWSALNRLEMLALTDVAKLIKTERNVIQSEVNQLIRQRAKNIVANARFKANESVINYIVKEIAEGTIQASAVGLQLLNIIKEPLAGGVLWWKAETEWWPYLYEKLGFQEEELTNVAINSQQELIDETKEDGTYVELTDSEQKEYDLEYDKMLSDPNYAWP